MTEFKAVDPLTVEITLAAPNGDLPTILSTHHFMIIADGTTNFAKANGTGAFVCETFEPGVRSIGIKNKNYFKAGGANLDSFEFFAITDDTARVNALLSGDIQLAAAINPRSMRLVESQPGVVLSKTTTGNYTNLNMRLDMTPGNKADFVAGMKYLLNREQIQKSALRGLAEIANDQPVPPTNVYHNEELKPKAFDPERAKSLFQKAGVLGQSIPIVASDAAGSSVDMAVIVQQAGNAIGMKFDIQRVPSDGYWSNYWLKAPIHFGNINPRPTPDILFSLLYASNAPWNESQYKSEKFDKMLLEARGSLDEAKRKADLRRDAGDGGGRGRHGHPRLHLQCRRHLEQAEGPAAEPARRHDGLRLRRIRLARRLKPAPHAGRTCVRPAFHATLHLEVSAAGAWMNLHLLSLLGGRLLVALLTLLIVSFVVFCATQMLPGDVAEILLGQAATPEAVAGLREAMHLNDPAIMRFFRWLGGMLTGDLGISYANNMPDRRTHRRAAEQFAAARGCHGPVLGADCALAGHHLPPCCAARSTTARSRWRRSR